MCLPYRSSDQEAELRFPNWARFRHYERPVKRFIAPPKYTPAPHNRRLIIRTLPPISQAEAQQQRLIASCPSVKCGAVEDVSKINHNIPGKNLSNPKG